MALIQTTMYFVGKGFEVRGSEIANRLTAWQNLIEATRASGQLAVNPLDESPPHTHNPIFQSLVRSDFSRFLIL